jgi:diphthamide synthase (EF-2-diphthine--ammonia ligase)
LLQVAALGLDPHKHLGKSLQQLEGHLLKLREQYGCNPCGEGGEYETLTLDCPAFVKGRIVLKEWQVGGGRGRGSRGSGDSSGSSTSVGSGAEISLKQQQQAEQQGL